MVSFMNKIINDFNQEIGWDEETTYPYIVNIRKALIDFKIPSSFNIQLSSQTSPSTYSSMKLSNHSQLLSGSISYIYQNVHGNELYYSLSSIANLNGEKNENHRVNVEKSDIPSNISSGKVRNIYSVSEDELANVTKADFPCQTDENNNNYNHKEPFQSSCLYYGQMYFPYSILEGIHIKTLSNNSRIQTKIWSTKTNFLFTTYYQYKNKHRTYELCYSSPESLIGYRTLYTFPLMPSPDMPSILHYDEISLGGELWLGFKNLIPNCSLSLRYKTRTGKRNRPLNFTISFNPLLGHLSSTFGLINLVNKDPIKTLGVFSKYDFNVYSLESNISLGLSCKGLKLSADLQNQRLKLLLNKKLTDDLLVKGGFEISSSPSIHIKKDAVSNNGSVVYNTNSGLELAPLTFGIELQYVAS
ncbi:uncharacterized protein SCODWIG_01991 [Saccharomycodes ludwigii]|uniref:Mitochondrial distribution and morphology protein 10 n=1 Tax=Saccharomycodes ludwigii TaxID=36035 RepID=A0A376B7X8_9ASCO|nr:hypothetical protein SCDLUD_001497 [Saccharomycodes ludwigii]KAH3901724.1 hypothetical protein SCDLUD_001497 [Saccharomycodes ludwigii]SSD60230.1 uncharacterized protein SCODWIG_01991 [Saccharomycodes ludwigii]